MDESMSESQTYRMIGADGNTYGPVDFATLRAWAKDNRVKPDTQIINESTGSQTQARFVPGLFDEDTSTAYRMQAPVVEEPAAPKKSNGWVVVGLVCLFGCCGCGLLGSAVLFPVFAQAKYAAKKTAGISRIKQLGLALTIYQTDFDDVYPPNMSSAVKAKDALEMYADPSVFVSLNPKGGEILGNAKLARRSAVDLANPAITVTFYDERPWERGESLAVYADSSAKMHPSQSTVLSQLKSDPFLRPTK
jgi:hypothetical protein